MKWDKAAIFIAETSDKEWIAMVHDLDWNFTGVHPNYRKRGLATAVKVQMLTVARARGIERLHTENHADNAPMLAVNRKLGFIPGVPEIGCVKYINGRQGGDAAPDDYPGAITATIPSRQ